MLETFLNVCHSSFSPIRWFLWQRVCPVSYTSLQYLKTLNSHMILFRKNFLIYMPNICGYQLMVDGGFIPHQPVTSLFLKVLAHQHSYLWLGPGPRWKKNPKNPHSMQYKVACVVLGFVLLSPFWFPHLISFKFSKWSIFLKYLLPSVFI